ncbi:MULTISPECIES: hypothetical protein [Methylobacterium]|uniref:hypothetical protein n=1 Tax=Methylobacterium TaxID=407 RepID=UPI0012E765D8|nr:MULTISPECIES: hypothetical protein [Methylobacterium]MCI9879186.1 hypothetical protein [Methylobacterium goesingense]
MTDQAIDRGGPGTRLADARPRQRRDAAPAPRWLRLGIAGLLGAVAGAVLFPTRAEGEPPARDGRRPPRR